jgi:hypothetical protein
VRAAIAVLFAVTLVSSASAAAERRYTSPDQQLYAVIGRGRTPENGFVEVYTANGRLITAWGFGGPRGTHRQVLRPAWSADSKRFLFTVTSSAPQRRSARFAFVRGAREIREVR